MAITTFAGQVTTKIVGSTNSQREFLSQYCISKNSTQPAPGWALLQKTPHNWVTEHGDDQSSADKQGSSRLRTAFTGPEGAAQATGWKVITNPTPEWNLPATMIMTWHGAQNVPTVARASQEQAQALSIPLCAGGVTKFQYHSIASPLCTNRGITDPLQMGRAGFSFVWFLIE